MKLTILFIASMILAPAQDQHGLEAEVGKLEARRFRAMTEADVPTLERLLSDDLVYTHASGWRQSQTASPRATKALRPSPPAKSIYPSHWGPGSSPLRRVQCAG